MKIAVVILNWNGVALLKQFLPSVVAHSTGATIYVADNASTDTSVDYVLSNFPEVKIVQNSINGGYAKGYNDALELIDADIFCLLNSDVEVTENWLLPVQEAFEKYKDVAAIQPKILDYKKKDHFEYAGAGGGFIDKLGYPYCRGRIFNTLEKDEGQYNDTIPIFWASGACLFIKKSVFEEVGKFDESFFAHMEEIDLCWRIHNCEYRILYVGTSVIYHVGGATLDSMNPKKAFFNFRNSLFALIKNVKTPQIILLILLRMILDGIAGLKFLTEGKIPHIFAILKAHVSFYKNIPQLLKKRKNFPLKKKYYTIWSVVWRHFVQKRKKYDEL